MAIDIVARGLAASMLGEDGRVAVNKRPVLSGTEGLDFTSVGQLTDSSLVEGKTAEEILLMILYGVVNPTIVEPNFDVILSERDEPLIIGRATSLKGTLVFDRGAIDPAYGTSGFRSGAPIEYSINGLSFEPTSLVYDFEIELTPASETETLICAVFYEAGEQPVNSIGSPVGTPLPAGSLAKELQLRAYYPLYSASGAEQNFEWFADEDGEGYLSTFASENSGTRQSFAVNSEHTVIGVKAFNLLTQKWEWIGSQTAAVSLTYFNISVFNDNYILYTYNSTPVGERELRIYVE